ncbi:ornithine cyclodeaminase family protein [Pseudonocardia spinosispora]|uniref:ornithine cyclodeaminase family protein n=1 Tax=Pseudonocardia spinosispora TaxID=103441 RepID=UPI0003FB191E|nr:ornithine cyclodeaminase family protein [Pseudonocardia spinosispora]
MPLIIDDAMVDRLLPPKAAHSCVKHAFELLARGDASDQARERSGIDDVTVNVMSAIAPTLDAVVVKSYPVVRTDVFRASVITILLHSHSTGTLRALVRGDLLGRRRTAAASAVAARVMARPESSTVCLFGTGFQAPAQVDALVEVLPQLTTVLVVGRDARRAEVTAAALRAAHPLLRVESGTCAETAVPRADVVVTATSAATPLFDGRLLAPGTHVTAVGSNDARRRELDAVVIDRAAHVVVDSRAVAVKECGDLLANGFDPTTVTEFAEVQAGQAVGRARAEDITVFESHGMALQDLVCSVHVVDAARTAGLGVELDSSWAAVPAGTR